MATIEELRADYALATSSSGQSTSPEQVAAGRRCDKAFLTLLDGFEAGCYMIPSIRIPDMMTPAEKAFGAAAEALAALPGKEKSYAGD